MTVSGNTHWRDLFTDAKGALADFDLGLGRGVDMNEEHARRVAGAVFGVNGEAHGVVAGTACAQRARGAVQGVLDRSVGHAALIEKPFGQAIDDGGCVGAVVGYLCHGSHVDGGGVGTFNVEHSIDDGLGVADRGVNRGVERFVGVQGGCHDAFVGLHAHCVHSLGCVDNEVFDTRHIDVA